ncbi:PH domain-containing protein [Thermomonospora umbrina]|uniref:PH (Pleckstrin Homology) domain-containing protein n=1 Tax=Thermomonospora umbrina TaxID=111806 RepID=A0A3D9SRQ8_9ACTN|nr:PH domain-containing protein [Thermomonospora umbrina]REE98287.1 PH (Pleckstrin Homology) domain-containing protein [Thermomonospora umbrina]
MRSTGHTGGPGARGSLVLRSSAGRVGAWVWLAFAAFNFADLAWRGRDLAALIAAAVLLTGCGVAYVLGLRPRVVAGADGLEIRNPLRDVRVPWPAVRKIEAADAITVRFSGAGDTERTARAWVLQTSPRARAREERQIRRQARHLPPGVAGQVVERSSLGHAVEQLNALAARHPETSRDRPSEGTVTWSVVALIAIALPSALLVILIAVAAAR